MARALKGEHSSEYLQSVLRDNAFITDGLSGEQLDIRGQCVSVAPVNTEAEDTRIITKESPYLWARRAASGARASVTTTSPTSFLPCVYPSLDIS